MRVLIVTFGSTGDVYPFLALGAELASRGHEVSLACPSSFRGEVLQAGLEHLEVLGESNQEQIREFMREAAKLGKPVKILRYMYRKLAPGLPEVADALREQLKEHDVLVASYLFPVFKHIAREAKKPFVTVALAHNAIPRKDLPPENVPPLPLPVLGRYWSRFWWKMADRFVRSVIRHSLGVYLDRADLPAPQHFFTRPGDGVLVGVSPSLFAPPREALSSRFAYVGYLRWQPPARALHAETKKRLEAIEPVSILTFGSVAFAEIREVMERFLRAWPRGKPIVIQSGWAGLDADDRHYPNIMVVGKLPHDTLFKYASVVIHHGGSGTTASALHAGKPQIVIPHIADQWFWANQVKRLGVGMELARRSWPEKLPQAVAALTANPACREAAAQIAERLKEENGARRSADLLEQLLAAE